GPPGKSGLACQGVEEDFGEPAAVVVPRAEEQDCPFGRTGWHGCSGRWAAHRSISPMTMSILPTIAGISAMRQPRQRAFVTLRFQKLDDRARTRSGTGSLVLRPTT